MTKAYAIGAATLVAVMLAGLALFAYQPPFCARCWG